jgi:hypothetical protein
LSSATEILKQKEAILNNSPNRFFSEVEKAQNQLLRTAIKEIEKLEVSNGKIVLNASNIAVIERVDEMLRNTLLRGDYLKAVTKLMEQMTDSNQLTLDFYRLEFDLDKSEMASKVFAIQRQKVLDVLIGRSSMDANFLQPIKNTLIDAVSERMPLNELIKQIRQVTTGEEGQYLGRLMRYSKQIANDALNVTDRVINNVIADEIGVQFFHYVGGTIEDTRCFCEKRNRKFFHRKEIEAWGRGDITDGIEDGSECETDNGWAGMFRETNETNIFTWLGGYNCKHSLVPKSARSVPKEVLNRAILKGYWKPTAKEKKLLNL